MPEERIVIVDENDKVFGNSLENYIKEKLLKEPQDYLFIILKKKFY